MRWFALVLVACTGCDLLFDIHTLALSPDGPPAPDAIAATDGQPSGSACSPITMLADDFTIDRLATVWPQTTALASNQVSVQDGQLVMANLAANSYATLDPGRYYDLRDNFFSARIGDDGHLDSNDYVQLELDSQRAGYGAQVSRDNANVTITVLAPSSPPRKLAGFAYNSATQQYVRVGVIGGALVFGTSPDGVAWTEQASLADASGYTFVHPTIQTHRGSSSPQFTVYVDDVNGGTPTGTACPIGQLRDDFMAINLGEQWARSPHTAGMLTLIGGIADVETTGTNSKVGLEASTVYDLTNGAISVEIPKMIGNSPQNTVAFGITTATGDALTISQTNGTVGMLARAGGSSMMMTLPYDPQTMRWWQITNASGTLSAAFSIDGIAWHLLPQQAVLSGLDRCDVAITVTSNSGAAGDVQLDNVNTP